jgi:hypothetical protein
VLSQADFKQCQSMLAKFAVYGSRFLKNILPVGSEQRSGAGTTIEHSSCDEQQTITD